MSRVLLIEDDESVSAEVKRVIEHDGHEVAPAASILEAREQLSQANFDLLILDWGLPDGDGVTFCRELREAGERAAILLLTGRASASDKETGLDAGADDYLTKPFHIKELLLRSRSLLSRSRRPLSADVLTAGEIVVDPKNFAATKSGADLKLTPKEFALLEFFMRNRNQVFSIGELLSHVWLAEEEGGDETVRTFIKTLRKKVDDPEKDSMIQTVHALGYRFTG